jgi:hypothetical protein
MRPPGDRARFTLRLRPNIPRKVAENPRVIGDFNGFDLKTAVPLTTGTDGVLRAAIAYRGDSSRIQVLGVGTRGAWMPVRSWALSPALPDLVPRFAGVIVPRRDTLFVAVDTSRRAPDKRAPTIVTEPYDSTTAQVNTLLLAHNDTWTSEQTLEPWEPDRATRLRARTLDSTRRVMTASTDPVVRAHALVTLLVLSTRPNPDLRDDSRRFFETVAPGSRITMDRDGLSAAAVALEWVRPDSGAPARDTIASHSLAAEVARAYFLPVARAMAVDTNTRKNAWLNTAYALEKVKEPEIDAYIDAYIDEALAAFPKDPIMQHLPQSMGSRRVLREGAAFPSFRLTSIGEPATEITNATFAGKLTLVASGAPGVDHVSSRCRSCTARMSASATAASPSSASPQTSRWTWCGSSARASGRCRG